MKQADNQSEGIKGLESRWKHLAPATLADDALTHSPALARHAVDERPSSVQTRSGNALGRLTFRPGNQCHRAAGVEDPAERLSEDARQYFAARAFAVSPDGIFIADLAGRIVAANRQSELLTGYAEDDLRRRRIDELFFLPDDDDFMFRLEHDLEAAERWEGEVWQRRKDGSGCPGIASFTRVADDRGEPPHLVIFFKDLTEQLIANKRIEDLAYHDPLTGLPNRFLLGERIEFALNWSARERKSFALLFVDLDRFKQINDSLGHAFGDRVLVDVANRIKACLRQSDTAARLGGDEFVLLLHDVDVARTEYTAERITAALSQPFVLDGISFMLTCSIGIALYPEDGKTADDLLKNADVAMYRVKDDGRAGFRFYQKQINADLQARLKLEQAIRQALGRGGFRLHFQPQFEMPGSRIVGAEALVRWRDPELGEIPPERFLSLAEDSALIIAIGDWVIEQALRQAREWGRNGIELHIAVNVSALQFRKPDFVSSLATALQNSGLPPATLELEFSESILSQDPDKALVRLHALAELGVRLSIHNFGAGYSSLSYLKRCPIHRLKIDRSFLTRLPDEPADAAIATAVIQIGRALKLEVIAEGVETPAQRAFLEREGCRQFQGFLFSPALEAEALAALVRGTAQIPV